MKVRDLEHRLPRRAAGVDEIANIDVARGHDAVERPPATIALFCICIAFVPLLSLVGVAGYLFRPLAMAVVFAMIASYLLTYTLAPTMAHFLLRNQHHHAASDNPRPPGVFARFQHGFEHYFEGLRQGTPSLGRDS